MCDGNDSEWRFAVLCRSCDYMHVRVCAVSGVLPVSSLATLRTVENTCTLQAVSLQSSLNVNDGGIFQQLTLAERVFTGATLKRGICYGNVSVRPSVCHTLYCV